MPSLLPEKWKVSFDPKLTEVRPFLLSLGVTVLVRTAQRLGSFQLQRFYHLPSDVLRLPCTRSTPTVVILPAPRADGGGPDERELGHRASAPPTQVQPWPLLSCAHGAGSAAPLQASAAERRGPFRPLCPWHEVLGLIHTSQSGRIQSSSPARAGNRQVITTKPPLSLSSSWLPPYHITSSLEGLKMHLSISKHREAVKDSAIFN